MHLHRLLLLLLIQQVRLQLLPLQELLPWALPRVLELLPRVLDPWVLDLLPLPLPLPLPLLLPLLLQHLLPAAVLPLLCGSADHLLPFCGGARKPHLPLLLQHLLPACVIGGASAAHGAQQQLLASSARRRRSQGHSPAEVPHQP